MRVRTLAVPLLLSLLVVACAQQAPESKSVPEPRNNPAAKPAPPKAANPLGEKTFLFISNANSPFWDAVDAGIQKGAEETGVPARLERNSGGGVPGQIKLLEEAQASKDKLAGVAISVLQPDAAGILQAMKKLRDAGVKVITVDSDCKPEYRDLFVGTNNQAAGEALGKEAARLMPGGAKLCMFVGDPSSQNAMDRKNGFLKGAGAKFKLVEEYKDDTDPTKARTNAENALVAHSDVTLMVGLWSYNGPAIAEAVKNGGKAKSVTVLAFDAEPNLLPLLEQGAVAAALVQKPYEIGRQGVQALFALAKGDQAALAKLSPKDGKIDTGMSVVTPKTYPEFKRYLQEKGLKSS